MAQTVPNYSGLVRFLIEPFLEQPESLSVDCEFSASRSRVLVRVAFESSEKGRVFGRGGRNIQAIRIVLEGFARSAGHTAHLDVYGGGVHQESSDAEGGHRASADRRPSQRRNSRPRSKS